MGGACAPGYDVRLWPMNLRFAESTARLIAHPEFGKLVSGGNGKLEVWKSLNVQMDKPENPTFWSTNNWFVDVFPFPRCLSLRVGVSFLGCVYVVVAVAVKVSSLKRLISSRTSQVKAYKLNNQLVVSTHLKISVKLKWIISPARGWTLNLFKATTQTKFIFNQIKPWVSRDELHLQRKGTVAQTTCINKQFLS